ncbi:DMT family transporter [Candidatus Roizmanbacteria bacterium]|nr:DMT family transporter [Candidatus Roizmanbacteria bacterium]
MFIKTNKETTGFIFALSDMVTYGLVAVFANYFVRNINPQLFAATTTLLGSFPLLIQLKIQNKQYDLYSPKFLPYFLIISLLTAIATSLFFAGTKLTSGINTGLLIQLEPIYAIILAGIFLKEVITGNQIAVTIVMVLGALFLVYKGTSQLNFGDILILITPIFFQISHLFSKRIVDKVSDVNIIPAARLFYSGIILTVFAFVINPLSFKQILDFNNFISIIFFAFIFRTLDLALWYQAIARISIAKASALIPFAAVVSFTGSIIFLKEVPRLNQYIGLVLILGGLTYLSLIHLKTAKE